MNNKLIWVFREPRSGSSWVSNVLADELQKSLLHYEGHYDRNKIFDPYLFQSDEKLYSTHLFQLLSKLKPIDPYIIRTTRRNKTEQCLSVLYWNYFPNSLKQYYVDESRNTETHNFHKSLLNPVNVKKQDVIDVMTKIKQRDKLWEVSYKNFKSCVIVYEDLTNEVNLPDLEITLSFEKNKSFIQKMPEYKSKVFSNYEQVVYWCEEITNKLNFIQY